jgi:hypothetical protein
MRQTVNCYRQFISGLGLCGPCSFALRQQIAQVERRRLFRKSFEDSELEEPLAVRVPLRLQLLVAVQALAKLEELAVLPGRRG